MQKDIDYLENGLSFWGIHSTPAANSSYKFICSKIPVIERKLNSVLQILTQRIDGIDQSLFMKSFGVANKLLADLRDAMTEYLTNLHKMDIDISRANNRFNKKCDILINEAKPILEKELGWSDYLSNLLKTIANAIIWTATLGQVATLFIPLKPSSIQVVEEVLSMLK